jgi:hypothetical protein
MTWLRNLARLWVVLSLAFLVWMLFGGAEATPEGNQWLGLLFFPIGVAAGLILTFWRERLGGALALLSLGAFYLQREGDVAGPWPALIAAPALLFLIVGGRRPAAPETA